MLKTRKAILVHGAVAAYLAPRLAQDAKIDLTPVLEGVTRRNYSAKKGAIATAITAAVAGKLAQDADIGDVVTMLDALEGVTDGEVDDDMIAEAVETVEGSEEDKPAVDADGDVLAKIMAFLKGKISDEDMAELSAMAGAEVAEDEDGTNEPPAKPNGPKAITKTAMDAALKSATAATIARMNAIAQAREDVEPVIGKVALSMDSASGIYKLALDHLGVETAGVHPSAFAAMLKVARTATTQSLAQDSAVVNHSDAAAKFRKENPGAVTLIRS